MTSTTTTTTNDSITMEPAKVWRALTEPKLLAEWLMATDLDRDPTVGRAFQFRAEPAPWWDGIVDCEVIEVERGKRLAYTWKGGPAASKLDTIVTWTLTATPTGGTLLRLEHTGFTPKNGFAFGGARDGWQRNVDQRLRAVLAELATTGGDT